MSQLFISKSTSTLINQTLSSTASKITSNWNPTLSIIKISPQVKFHIQTQIFRQRYNSTLKQNERISNNISKLYARRMLMMAALSASSMKKKTLMEELVPTKPKEWRTVDLEKQRREFGENINSLGESRISRVWAAGEGIIAFFFSMKILFMLFLF